MNKLIIPCVVCLVYLIHSIEGDVVLQIHLHRFSNNAGKDANGHCCDLFCASKCDHAFTFCVDEHQSSPNDHRNVDFDDCSYYEEGTGRMQSGKVLYFADQNSLNGVNNPIVIKRSSWPGKAQFKIRIMDDDSTSGDDLVDTMYTTLEKAPSFGIEVWTAIQVIEGTRTKAPPTTMEIMYSVHCTEDYYGPRCDKLCVPQDSPTVGHYTCDTQTGRKICLPGYEGAACRIPSNDCAPTTCRNGGTCIDGNMDYTCLCTAGYTGNKCQRELKHCESDPCQNGATCLDETGQYLCLCPPSYVGTNCEYHVCETESGCLNGGTCVGNDPWECYCPVGFTGTRCETNICNLLDCQNHGVCALGICLCPSAYTGRECETRIDICVSLEISCENGATCENGVCMCPAGYVGDRCQGIRNYCSSNPCYNNATCYNGEAGYFCVCKSEFFGGECQYMTTTSTSTTTSTLSTSTTLRSTAMPVPTAGPTTRIVGAQPPTTTTSTTSTSTTTSTTPAPTQVPKLSANDAGINVLAATGGDNKGFAWWIYVVIGVGGLLLIAMILFAVLMTKYNRKKKQLRNAKRTIERGESFDNAAYDHESNIYENSPEGAENNLNIVSNNLNLNIVPREKVVYDVPVPRRQPIGTHSNNSSRQPARLPQGRDQSIPKATNLNKAPGANTPKELQDRYLALKQAALNK